MAVIVCGLLTVLLRSFRVHHLLNSFMAERYWVPVLLGLCCLAVAFLPHQSAFGYVVGLLSPSGLMLPVVAGAYLHRVVCQRHQLVLGLRLGDVVCLSSLQLLLMLSAWTVLPWDVYRYGYTSWAVAVAAALGGYAYVRKLDVIAIVVVLSLLLWSVGVGSTNYFDWIGHAALLVCAWVWLAKALCMWVYRRVLHYFYAK